MFLIFGATFFQNSWSLWRSFNKSVLGACSLFFGATLFQNSWSLWRSFNKSVLEFPRCFDKTRLHLVVCGLKKSLKHDLTCEAVGLLASQKALVGGGRRR